MCQTHTDIISLDENVDFSAVKPITDRYNVVLQGNIPIVSCMLPGQPQDVMAYVAMMLQGLPDQHNLILSPGCDLPYDTPTENVAAAFDALCQRESLSISAVEPLA
jgi:uroporphyrinogen decarboxylase